MLVAANQKAKLILLTKAISTNINLSEVTMAAEAVAQNLAKWVTKLLT